jgi:hypothetical protein
MLEREAFSRLPRVEHELGGSRGLRIAGLHHMTGLRNA